MVCGGSGVYSVTPIDQIDDHFDYGVFLFRLAFGNQQGQGDQCIVGQTLAAVSTIEDVIGVQEVDEEGRGDSLVAIAESMVFDNEVEQVGSFLFGAGI